MADDLGRQAPCLKEKRHRRHHGRDSKRRRDKSDERASPRRSSDAPPHDRSKRRRKSQSSSGHGRKHRSRDGRERSSSEDSRRSRSPSRDKPKDRKKSKFELKTEKLKVVSQGPPAADRLQNIVSPTATKLVEEINKRKLIFSKKPSEPSASSSAQAFYEDTKFTDDPDGNMQAKFKRLMGMKSNGTVSSGGLEGGNRSSSQPTSGKAQQYLADLEKQYEVARVATHTQRGLGLGFSSRALPQ